MSIAPANNTVAYIRQKVRRLVAAPSENSLPTNELDQYINDFYANDFIYGVKLDVLKKVYTFFTSPNVDRYPLNVNQYQSMRAPIYFQGVKGTFYKDRNAFFNVWSRQFSRSTPAAGDGVTTLFNFTLSPVPFLSKSVTISGTDITGTPFKLTDDGGRNTTVGNLLFITTDATGDQVPATPNTSPIPPAFPVPTNTVGTVNYVTGQVAFTLPVAPAAGSVITAFVSPYQAGRPYSLLFWNNEFQVRPVPDNVYKVEVESYMTPTEFMTVSDQPGLDQWTDYISLGAAMKILEDRQDMQGISILKPRFDEQQGLVLERQANEEIGVRNSTIFTSPTFNGDSSFPFDGGW